MLRLVIVTFSLLIVSAIKIHTPRSIKNIVEVDAGIISEIYESRNSKEATTELGSNGVVKRTASDDSTNVKSNSKTTKKKYQGKSKSLRNHLLEVLLSGDDPFDYTDNREWPDDDYPFTNLNPSIVELVFRIQENIQQRPVEFYLELGTMFGGSLEIAHAANPNITMLAIDTFLGDVSMWVWESKARRPAHLMEFDFLDLHGGQPRVYERFLYTVKKRGFHHKVVPFRTTTIVGMKVLLRLFQEGHLRQRPEVIYLDSAHEKVETLLEIQEAWCLLPESGILFGDDWLWESVKSDVLKFSKKLKKTDDSVALANKIVDPQGKIEIIDRRIVVFDNQTWLLIKLPSDKACINAFAK
jgi:hypothetical protein